MLFKLDLVEKPAETQISIRLASHLVRAPNSRSGGHGSNPLCGGKPNPCMCSTAAYRGSELISSRSGVMRSN
jgi:hypothetical protein